MERLEARLAEKQKSAIQEAAALTGRTLTDFVVGKAYEAALETIEQHRLLRLSAKDSKFFVDKISKPPKVGVRLRKALKAHDKLIGS